MASFANISRTIQLGTAWTGTAPGPGVATPSGTISSASDVTGYISGGAEPVLNAAMLDATTFGSLGYSVMIPGLTSADDLVITANADVAASAWHSIIQTTIGGIARPGSSPIYFDVKPTTGSRAATNPSFVGAAYVMQYKPYTGNVGDKAVSSLTLKITGTFIILTS